MWRVVVGKVAVTIGIVLVASGCGTTAASDPFVGSWSASGKTSADAVISRTSDGYRVTLLAYGGALSTLSFKRNGDRLEATVSVRGASLSPWSIVVERREGSDRLFWTEGGATVKLSRVSDSTALPSASPTGP